MKKLSLLIILFCVSLMTMAQDVIVKKDGSTIQSKVMEINSTEIKYRKWSNQEGPTYSINRSEVMSINYENGEVELFSDKPSSQTYNNTQQNTQSFHRGFMEPGRTTLKLDGRSLSNGEVRLLVGEQYYQLYKKGRNLGIGFYATFIPSCVTGGFAMAFMKGLVDGKQQYESLVITLSVISVAGFVSSFVMASSSTSKMRQVADAYNNGQTNQLSFSISPTMMKCETPQSQSNYGFGLTVSMNF